MAALILPSRFNRQPQGPVEIDHNNPIAKCIEVCIFAGNGIVHDRVKNIPFTLTGSAYTSQTRVIQPGFVSNGSSYYTGPLPSTLYGQELTLFAFASAQAATTAQSPIIGIVKPGSAGIGVCIQSNFAGIEYPAICVSSTIAGTGSTANQLRNTPRTFSVRSTGGNSHDLYIGGRSVLNRTDTLATFDSSFNLLIGRFAQANFAFYNASENANVYLAAAWSRRLSDTELVELDTNPWQIFRKRPQVLYFDVGGGATSYTLTADAGSFTLTGQAAGLTAQRKIAADAGSFTLTGNASNLLRGYALPGAVGAFTLTGSDAGLRAARTVTAAAGSYTLTGNDATLTKTTVGAFTLTADAGAFALTGQAANLLAGRKIAADAGSFTLTGNDATLTKTTAGAYSLNCETATFALTGSAAGLIATRTMPAVTGSFTLTGSAAALTYGRAVVAEPGAFTLTGNDATLRGPVRMTAEPGVFTLTGNAATLNYSGYVAPLAVEMLTAAARDTQLTAPARDTTLESRHAVHG